MPAYPKEYLSDVVENQGKLFDLVSQNYPDKDTFDFINTYMTSKTRRSIDEAKAYVNTMSASELWDYFCKTDGFKLKNGKAAKIINAIYFNNPKKNRNFALSFLKKKFFINFFSQWLLQTRII